jgi:hypothetical protein
MRTRGHRDHLPLHQATSAYGEAESDLDAGESSDDGDAKAEFDPGEGESNGVHISVVSPSPLGTLADLAPFSQQCSWVWIGGDGDGWWADRWWWCEAQARAA